MSSAAPSSSTALVARPYRDFLTPLLHRRFTSAALLTFVVCYAEAIFMGTWDLFWSWFPFGPTGLRSIILFISILWVYMLRVARLHIGARTSASSFATFSEYLSNSLLAILQTTLWYMFSACFFGEVYIWSAPTGANLAIISSTPTYVRAHLNERSIYLRTLFPMLGIAQGLYHLYRDCDRLPFETIKAADSTNSTPSVPAPTFVKALRQMKPRCLSLIKYVPIRTFSAVAVATIFYALLFQRFAWWCFFGVTRPIYGLPKLSSPSTIPAAPATLLLHALTSALLLNFLWEFANVAFGAFVGQEPMKKGVVLSAGAKGQANSALISGLKSKKDVIKSFAYWELVIIATSSETRRYSIFSDMKIGNTPSTWSDIVSVCLGELQAVAKRIQDFQQPAPTPSQQSSGQTQQPTLQTLPKITAPLSQGNILIKAPPPPKTRSVAKENNVSVLAKPHVLTSGAKALIAPPAHKLLTYTEEKLLPEQTPSMADMKQQLYSYVVKFLQSPLGFPFRQTFARRAIAIVFGTPYSQLSPTVDAVVTLTKLANASLTEDPIGTVAPDVPTIIRVFTKTCDTIEQFMQSLPVHWTDVEFDEKSEEKGRKVAEVEILVTQLREGLKVLVNQFGEYADTLGLTRAEMRQAKEVVQRGNQEMVKS